MCGRFQLTATPEQVRALFSYEEQPNFPPREAIAPTEPIAIVTQERGRRRFMLVRWGFLPSYLKDATGFPLLFNARGETVAEKAAFRHAIRRRRCLVPSTGFYEWRREGQGRTAVRTPHLCTRADGAPMALAAIWETNVSADGGEIDTAAILTTAANGVMAAIHERMPVIVEPRDFETWLNCDDELATNALSLIRPAAEDVLDLAPVNPALPKPMSRMSPLRASAPPRTRGNDGDDGQGTLF